MNTLRNLVMAVLLCCCVSSNNCWEWPWTPEIDSGKDLVVERNKNYVDFDEVILPLVYSNLSFKLSSFKSQAELDSHIQRCKNEISWKKAYSPRDDFDKELKEGFEIVQPERKIINYQEHVKRVADSGNKEEINREILALSRCYCKSEKDAKKCTDDMYDEYRIKSLDEIDISIFDANTLTNYILPAFKNIDPTYLENCIKCTEEQKTESIKYHNAANVVATTRKIQKLKEYVEELKYNKEVKELFPNARESHEDERIRLIINSTCKILYDRQMERLSWNRSDSTKRQITDDLMKSYEECVKNHTPQVPQPHQAESTQK